MAWPTQIPNYKRSWKKVFEEQIKLLYGQNNKQLNNKKLTHKQILDIAYRIAPKPKKAPLA